MTGQKFNQIVQEQVQKCADILQGKAKEYATEDRLHNFKVAADLQRTTPINALAGMMAKHTVSIYDMSRALNKLPPELWEEKITDSINYLFLLRALVEEQNESD